MTFLGRTASLPRAAGRALCLLAITVALGCGHAPPPQGQGGASPPATALDIHAFRLINTDTNSVSPLDDLTRGNPHGTVLFFTSSHCPIALQYEQHLPELRTALGAKGVGVLEINSNYAETPLAIKAHASEAGVATPIYTDVDGRLADALRVTRMSEAVLLDAAGRVVYQGRIDDQFEIRDPAVLVRRRTSSSTQSPPSRVRDRRPWREATPPGASFRAPRRCKRRRETPRSPIRATSRRCWSGDACPVTPRVGWGPWSSTRTTPSRLGPTRSRKCLPNIGCLRWIRWCRTLRIWQMEARRPQRRGAKLVLEVGSRGHAAGTRGRDRPAGRRHRVRTRRRERVGHRKSRPDFPHRAVRRSCESTETRSALPVVARLRLRG